MKFQPYLNFNGNCKEAFETYHRLLGGKLEMQTHEGSPMEDQTHAEWHDAILHARLVVDDAVLMASDSPPEHYAKPQGLYVSLTVDKEEDADRVFNGLAEGGQVQMPIGETFWAKRFGMLVDRFGTPWMVNCDKPT